MEIKVEWVPIQSAEERLRRVYELLLREDAEQKPVAGLTVLQLLRRGIDVEVE